MAHLGATEIAQRLGDQSYLADRGLATALFLALSLQRPLLLEGEAGVGKTEVAKAMAAGARPALIRLQCYEGIDISQALYEWDYTRQMLHIRALSRRRRRADDAVERTLRPRVPVERPLLQAVAGRRRAGAADRRDRPRRRRVRGLPARGAVRLPGHDPRDRHHRGRAPPVVVITSNRTRELHDALKRRCLYHWIDYPDPEREVGEIIPAARAPEVVTGPGRASVASSVARCASSTWRSRPGSARRWTGPDAPALGVERSTPTPSTSRWAPDQGTRRPAQGAPKTLAAEGLRRGGAGRHRARSRRPSPACCATRGCRSAQHEVTAAMDALQALEQSEPDGFDRALRLAMVHGRDELVALRPRLRPPPGRRACPSASRRARSSSAASRRCGASARARARSAAHTADRDSETASGGSRSLEPGDASELPSADLDQEGPYSALEVLRSKDFATYSPEELRAFRRRRLHALDQWPVADPAAARAGTAAGRLDMRRTLAGGHGRAGCRCGASTAARPRAAAGCSSCATCRARWPATRPPCCI